MSSIRDRAKEMTRTLVGMQMVSSPQCSLAHTIPFPNFIARNQTPVVPEPPYSSDLSTSKIFILTKTEGCLSESVEKMLE
jgi:hypothetical protein